MDRGGEHTTGREQQVEPSLINIELGAHISLGAPYRDLAEQARSGNPYAHVWLRPDKVPELKPRIGEGSLPYFQDNELMVARIKDLVARHPEKQVVVIPDSLPARGATIASEAAELVWMSLPAGPREIGLSELTVVGSDINALVTDDLETQSLRKAVGERLGWKYAIDSTGVEAAGAFAFIGAVTTAVTVGAGVAWATDKLQIPGKMSRRRFLQLTAGAVLAVGGLAVIGEGVAPGIANNQARVAKTLEEKDFWLGVATRYPGLWKAEVLNGRTAKWVTVAEEVAAGELAIIVAGQHHGSNYQGYVESGDRRHGAVARMVGITVEIVEEACKQVGLDGRGKAAAHQTAAELVAGYTVYQVSQPAGDRLPEGFLDSGKYIKTARQGRIESIYNTYSAMREEYADRN